MISKEMNDYFGIIPSHFGGNMLKQTKFEKEYFEDGPYAEIGGYGKVETVIKGFFLSLVRQLENLRVDYKNGKGKCALDVGCAYGYVLEVINSFGYNIYGIDISRHAIEVAKERLPHGTFACHDIQEDIQIEKKFDLVTCTDMLEHAQNPDAVIGNCYELLKSNGLFIISTPNKNCWMRYLPLLHRLPLSRKEDSTHINVRTIDEWKYSLNCLQWSAVNVVTLQTVPIIWRFGLYIRFRFPLGDTILIVARK